MQAPHSRSGASRSPGAVSAARPATPTFKVVAGAVDRAQTRAYCWPDRPAGSEVSCLELLAEGTSFNFTLEPEDGRPSRRDFSFQYETQDITATADVDYVPAHG